MFFSDLAALQKITTKQLGQNETRYGDHSGDPEIERMLNGSPLITGWEPTVQSDDLYAGDDQDSFNDRFDASGKSSRKRWKEIFGTNQPSPAETPLFREKSSVVVKQNSDDSKPISLLTKIMEDSKKSRRKEKNTAGKIKLTVYLPDYTSFHVYATEKMTISDLRSLILSDHLEQRLVPPLNYTNPNIYELRMTDGDGEPDRDFPALGLTQRLGELGIDEVCICEIDGGRGGGGGGGGIAAFSARPQSGKRSKPSVDFTFSASQFGSIPYGRSISQTRSTPPPLLAPDQYNQSISVPPYFRDRLDEDDEEDEDDDDDDDGRGLDNAYYESSKEPEDRIVTIKFPNGQDITLPYDEQSTLKSLLPVIAETHKLLLHSADYVFCVHQSELKRFKLMFPTVDMNVTIDSIGCQTFELQKRIFADSVVPKVPVPDIVTKSQRERMAAASSAAAAAAAAGGDTDAAFVFTEATANAYKEWNVVKKNKFGRRQERVFGVDGKKVYNSKRGQLKGTQTGVLRNQRDISTIVKIDILPTDPKTFRITWAEDRDMVNIEYTCDTSREAQEIVAKVKYLVNKSVRSAIHRGSSAR